MLRDIENLLMAGPSPTEAHESQSCGTCGRQAKLLWKAADAVRVQAGEDFEYKPGELEVLVCGTCAQAIHRHWIVMPDG